jgi:hypothetical protein
MVKFNRKRYWTESELLAGGAFIAGILSIMSEAREELLFVGKL